MQCCPLAPENNAQEKIMFNVVLILLGQHCTGQNHVQCSRDSKQNCTGKANALLSIQYHNSAIYFGLVHFLIITDCCKRHTNIAKEKSKATLNKKTRLYDIYQQNKSSESKVKFRQTSNHCKKVLEAAKLASLPRNLAFGTFGKLLIVFSTKSAK